MSKSTIKTYKHTVWDAFSLYIRARDANQLGYCFCCTCGKQLYWKSSDCHAGHFIPGRGGMVLYDETVVHAQCSNCNNPRRGGGRYLDYEDFMRKKYGYTWEQLQDIKIKRHQTKKFTMEELKELKKYFEAEFNRIQLEKGL